MIACILIADFATTVERQTHQSPLLFLNAAGKVQAASFEAVQQGVRVGMRLQQAQAFCTEAVAVPFNPGPHTEAINALTGLLSTFTNRIEVAPGFWETLSKKRTRKTIHPSAAVVYLDLGKLNNPQELTALARQIRFNLWDNLRVAAHIGLADNKFTASIAARFAHPHHPKLVSKGQEAAFLAALPITLLPLEGEAQRRLKLLGIHTLGQLAELSSGTLINQFGTAGRLMHQLAHGQDDRLVTLLQPQPIELLTLRLHGAVEDRLVIETVLQGMASDLQSRLEKRSYTLRGLELILHLDDGSLQPTRVTLRKPTGDGGQIGRSLIRLLSQLTLSQGMVTVEVSADDLQPIVWRQLDLFGQEFAAQDKLHQLLDNLTMRFGSDHFYQITLTAPDHRLLEKRFEIVPVEAA
jgi:nucleotidyltransferase/DNA polymerase involved in DNA repair